MHVYLIVIIDNYPTLKPEAIRVVGNAILKKIKDGISYGPELEAIIKVSSSESFGAIIIKF